MSAAKRSLEIEQLEDTINERTVFVHEMIIFFVGVVFGVINLVAHEDRANIISGIFILVSVTLTVGVSELLKKHISRLARGILLSTVQIIIIIAAGVTNSQLHTVHSLLVASVALSTIYFSRKNIVVQCTITNAVCIAGIFFMDKIYQGATLEVVIKSLVGVNVADYLIWYLVKTCAKYIIENRKDKEHSDELVEQINAEMAKASEMAIKTNSAVEKMARIAENLSSSATLMEQISGTLSAGAQEQESTVSEISSDIMGVVNQYDRCLDEADKSLQAAECNVTVLHEGNEVVQETRHWDDAAGHSRSMRSKEDAQDYKYFPEPDIPPIDISEEQIEAIRASLPELPEAKKARYINELGLPEYDTGIITGSLPLVKLFEHTCELTGNPKETANWIMVELLKLLNDSQTLPENMSFDLDSLAAIIKMVSANKINRGTAKKVFAEVFENNVDPVKYVEENNLGMMTDTSAIRAAIEEVVAANEKSVNEYKGGKTQALQYLIGQSMRVLKGKAPAQEVTAILKEILG